MAGTASTEGYVPYTPATAGKPCQTWFKTVGDLKSGVRPLVIVHGGPGVVHDYLLPLCDLAQEPYNIPLIFYDQIGNGRSTCLPEKLRDYSFWNEQLFLDELTALLTHLGVAGDYDLLGHSWGGMLGSSHAARQPLGLRRLVLTGTPVSGAAWTEAYRRYRDQMPPKYREILERPRSFGEKDTPEYEEAIGAFLYKHMFGWDSYPPEVLKTFEYGAKEPTVGLSS
jgi:proline-specific peptidase